MRAVTKIVLFSFVFHALPIATLYAKQYIEYPSWLVYFGDKNTNYKHYKVPADISKEGCLWGSWVTFAQKIEAIQIKARDISNPLNLFYSKDFIAMYKHPLYYRQAILEYLTNKNYSLEQKTIPIYAASNTDLYKSVYDLYKKKKINLEILSLVLAINLGNLVTYSDIPKVIERSLSPDLGSFIKQIMTEIPRESVLYKDLETLLNLKFPANWKPYVLSERETPVGNQLLTTYYRDLLPFYDIILNAVKDKQYYDCWSGLNRKEGPLGEEKPPHFLMVLEHPQYYYSKELPPYPTCSYRTDSDGRHRRNGVTILKDPKYAATEKDMVIFGMSQLGLFDPCESSQYYAWIIDQACQWYQQGALTDKHLYQLFICDIRTFYKYPFFILDYKDKSIQKALDRLINLPTLPDSVRTVAQKVKSGTLATEEEMAYMEKYRNFRKSHFTLYETIPSGQ